MNTKLIKKTYRIIISTVVIMAVCIGLSIYSINNKPVFQGSTGIEGIEDQIEDNINTGNSNDGSNSGSSNNSGSSSSSTVSKTYSNAFKCLEDMFKIIDNGKGIKVTNTITGVATSLGVTATQTIKEVGIISGDYYLKETFASCDFSLGKNFYRYYYSKDGGKNVELRSTTEHKNNVPNWNKEDINVTLPKEEIIEKYDLIAYDFFNVRPTKANTKFTKFDKTSNAKYYIIETHFDSNSIPQKYVKNAIREGELDSMKVTSLKLTFYIEKSTLYLRKIEREEQYVLTKGISATVDLYSELIVNSIDKSIIIERPNR